MATIAPPPPQVQKQIATRSHAPHILLVIVVILALAGVTVAWLFWKSPKDMAKAAIEATTIRPWIADDGYSVPPPPPVQAALTSRDTTGEELAKLNAKLTAMHQEIEELKKRKPGTTTTTAQHATQGAAAKPIEKRPAPMLYVNKDLQDKVTPASASEGRLEYVLAPWATYLPCIIQPLMNSDVPGNFTAKITQNVYDTRTGWHLLVPQGATIGGHDQGQTLLYGNERLPTVAISLTIEDRTYDLGQVPVTDQLGTNGLTGEVDNHFWRLAAAVLITGALKGGQQALQMSIAEAGGVGQVAGGISSTATQVTNQRAGRALDTRPTIRVFAGQSCNVLLTKPLNLPSVWQGPTAAALARQP